MKSQRFIWLVALMLLPFLSATAQDRTIIDGAAQVSADSIENYINTLVGFCTRHNLSTTTDSQKGIGAAACWLESEVARWIPASKGRLAVERQSYTTGGKGSRLARVVTLANIIATIQGTLHGSGAPEIVLLAHYDSRVDDNNDSLSFAPGANDNGSGVACLLEITRILAKSEPLPVTVRCAFLTGEEHGLLGAKAFAKKSKDENRNIIAVINNDMIGNVQASDTKQVNNTLVRVFSDDTPARELARYIKATASQYVDNIEVKLIYRNDRYGRGGDHSPFAAQGYTAVRLSEYHENYHRTHQKVHTANGIDYGDLPSGVDFEYVRKNTCVNLASVMSLALAPEAPTNVKMDLRTLSNFTAISWAGNAFAYRILMRETDQSTWQTLCTITGQNSAKIPYSKDNYFFAVQAVDDAGHASLAVEVK